MVTTLGIVLIVLVGCLVVTMFCVECLHAIASTFFKEKEKLND